MEKEITDYKKACEDLKLENDKLKLRYEKLKKHIDEQHHILKAFREADKLKIAESLRDHDIKILEPINPEMYLRYIRPANPENLKRILSACPGPFDLKNSEHARIFYFCLRQEPELQFSPEGDDYMLVIDRVRACIRGIEFFHEKGYIDQAHIDGIVFNNEGAGVVGANEKDGIISKKASQNGRKGGEQPKRLPGVDLAISEMLQDNPKMNSTAIWKELKKRAEKNGLVYGDYYIKFDVNTLYHSKGKTGAWKGLVKRSFEEYVSNIKNPLSKKST